MRTTLLILSALLGAIAASSGEGQATHDLGRVVLRSLSSQLQSRRLHERGLCKGGCESCFDPGYPDYGIDSCLYGTTSTTARPIAIRAVGPDIPALSYGLGSSASSTSTVDFCNNRGSTCTTCFGATYIICPNDSTHCYDPNDPSSTCSTSGSGQGIEASSVTGPTFPLSTGASATRGLLASTSLRSEAATAMTTTTTSESSSGLLFPPEQSATATTQAAASGGTESADAGTADESTPSASEASGLVLGSVSVKVVVAVGAIAMGRAWLVVL